MQSSSKNPIVPVVADVEQLSHVDQGKSATVFRESAFLQLVFAIVTWAIFRPAKGLLHVKVQSKNVMLLLRNLMIEYSTLTIIAATEEQDLLNLKEWFFPYIEFDMVNFGTTV